MPLSVSTSEQAGRVVLDLVGPVDLGTLPTWHGALTGLVADHPGRALAVDLDGVSVLDDTMLGTLLGATVAARDSGGSLSVICSRPPLLARLASIGLDRLLEVEPAAGPGTTGSTRP